MNNNNIINQNDCNFMNQNNLINQNNTNLMNYNDFIPINQNNNQYHNQYLNQINNFSEIDFSKIVYFRFSGLYISCLAIPIEFHDNDLVSTLIDKFRNKENFYYDNILNSFIMQMI